MVEDVMIMLNAWHNKQIDKWRRTRFLAFYSVVSWLEKEDRDIFKFLPLPGDPSEEEKKKMKEEQQRKKMQWIEETIRILREGEQTILNGNGG